jgi:hypothetical protein
MAFRDVKKRVLNLFGLGRANPPGIEFYGDGEEDKRQLAAYMKEMCDDAFKRIEKMVKEWKDNRKAYMNETFDHFLGDAAQTVQGASPANYGSGILSDKLEDLASIQVSSMPQVYPLPKHSEDPAMYPPERVEFAGEFVKALWEKSFEDLRERLGIRELYMKFIVDAGLCHATIAKIYQVEDPGMNREDACIDIVQPEDFAPSVEATEFKKAKMVFQRIYLTLYDAIQQFPKYEHELTAAVIGSGDKFPERGGTKKETTRLKGMVCLYECYVRDNTMVKKETDPLTTEDPETGELIITKQYKDVKKYPSGRKITMLDAGAGDYGGKAVATIVEDIPNPYKNIVYEMYCKHPVSWSPYGRCEGTPLRNLQYLDDNTMQQIRANLKLTGNETLLHDSRGLDPEDEWSNKVAQRVSVKHLGSVQYFKADNITPDGLNFHAALKRDADDLSGVYAAAEGRRSPSATSGRAIGMQQEATNRKVRPAQDIFAEFLQRVWRQVAEIMLVTYKEGRILRVSDDDGLPLMLPVDLAVVTESIDVTVDAESHFPVDPVSKFNMAMTMAQTPGPDGVPIIDPQTIMEMIRMPGISDILARRQKFVTQQTMQMGQGNMAPQPNAQGPQPGGGNVVDMASMAAQNAHPMSVQGGM